MSRLCSVAHAPSIRGRIRSSVRIEPRKLIKEGRYAIEDDVIGIVFPVYGFGIPEIVIRYLEKCTLTADHLFVIATYGNEDGAVLREMKKLLEAHGNHADHYKSLLMVDNYLSGYAVEDQLAKLPEKDIEGHLYQILEDIRQRKECYEDRGFAWNALTSVFNNHKEGIMNKRAVRLFSVSGERFRNPDVSVKEIIEANRR